MSKQKWIRPRHWHLNRGTDIGSTLERQWDHQRRQRNVDTWARVLAYLFRNDGPEHEAARAKDLEDSEYLLVEELRPRSSAIRTRLMETSEKPPQEDEHGLTARSIYDWVWSEADPDGHLRLGRYGTTEINVSLKIVDC